MTQDPIPAESAHQSRRPFRVVIRLRAELDTDPYDDLRDAATNNELVELSNTLSDLGVTGTRLVPKQIIDPAELRRRERQGRDDAPRDPDHDPASDEDPDDPELTASLTQYWLIDLSGRSDLTDEVAARIGRLDGVELAYVELPVINAGGHDGQASPVSAPSHLDPAPIGSNVHWAWQAHPQHGAGVQVLDVESGWFFEHEALSALGVELVGGTNQDGVGGFRGDHGTAALGIVAGTFVAPGGVHGLCPEAKVLAASPFNSDAPARPMASVLTEAFLSLRAGDVVLIEVAALEGGTTTRWQRPIERQIDVRDAIGLLTRAGIVVIEPAGNGNCDLDLLDSTTYSQLTPGRPYYVDSGAVMVGGAFVDASRPGPPARWASADDPAVGSNFGARVDCFSWARKVRTSGCRPWGNCSPRTSAYQNFNGTSSASAIIAGLAVLIQGMRHNAAQPALTSRELRQAFRASGTGTPSAPGSGIGAMPDLELVAKHLGI